MEISSFDPAELLREVHKEETMVHTEYRFALQQMDRMQIKADRNMLKQVLRILCDNAVKYSDAGTTITLSCSNHQNGYCRLSVKDEGSGIADKARKAESGGHGLGLSIARIIVVAHNGKIKVRSKPGFGTVFTVLLPSDR